MANPITIGDKLRNRRLEEGLLQKDLADIIGVTKDCITLWEGNKAKPHISYYPKLIGFLGFIPQLLESSTLAGKIKNFRFWSGLTQEDLAKKLGVNESTIFHYEKGTHKPSKAILKKLSEMLS